MAERIENLDHILHDWVQGEFLDWAKVKYKKKKKNWERACSGEDVILEAPSCAIIFSFFFGRLWSVHTFM